MKPLLSIKVFFCELYIRIYKFQECCFYNQKSANFFATNLKLATDIYIDKNEMFTTPAAMAALKHSSEMYSSARQQPDVSSVNLYSRKISVTILEDHLLNP